VKCAVTLPLFPRASQAAVPSQRPLQPSNLQDAPGAAVKTAKPGATAQSFAQEFSPNVTSAAEQSPVT